MTKQEMIALLDKVGSSTDYPAQWAKFYADPNRITHRPDLALFLLLDEILPEDYMIVQDACHGVMWLSIDPEKLAAVVTEEEVKELAELGLVYDVPAEQFVVGSEMFDAYDDEDEDDESETVA